MRVIIYDNLLIFLSECVMHFIFFMVKGDPLNSCESSPCTNGATCVDVNTDTFICVCRGGFFGVTCENSEY